RPRTCRRSAGGQLAECLRGQARPYDARPAHAARLRGGAAGEPEQHLREAGAVRGRGAVGMLAGSPTMVGSITVLIAIVAVFLAYNANTGLPFVPTYRVSVLVPDAASLLPGNEVRIGGVRVGQVESTEPVQSAAQCSNPSGQSTPGATCAKVDLKLDADVNPLPT